MMEIVMLRGHNFAGMSELSKIFGRTVRSSDYFKCRQWKLHNEKIYGRFG